MTQKRLFLDDERTPNSALKAGLIFGEEYTKKWTIVRDYESFVTHIEKNGIPDLISFDHDLGGNSLSGYDCAKWLVDFCFESGFNLPICKVHSANPVGKLNIQMYLKNAKEHLAL